MHALAPPQPSAMNRRWSLTHAMLHPLALQTQPIVWQYAGLRALSALLGALTVILLNEFA